MTDPQQAQGTTQDASSPQGLDISSLAAVEVTSEDELFPIEQAFQSESAIGWRAATPGEQRIRLVFHQPQPIAAVRLRFVERAAERRQVIVLRASTRTDSTLREVCRRDFRFSPSGLTDEIEEIALRVDDLTLLELTIDPDAPPGLHHDAYATLTRMQVMPPSDSGSKI